MLSWLKPRDATLSDLQHQLTEARAAHQQSIEAVAIAQVTFDDDPSALRGLLEAQQAERSAAAHVGRAERLFEAANAKAQAEERVKLERRFEKLQEQLSLPALQRLRAPTRDAEIEALKHVVAAHVERLKVETQVRELESDLKRVRVQLGEPTESVYASTSFASFNKPSTRDVADALTALYRPLGSADPRFHIALALQAYLNAL
jgi:hypothetical protein